MNVIEIAGIILPIIKLIVIPILFIYWSVFRKSKSKIDLLLRQLVIWIYFLYIYYTGRWDFPSYYLRYIFVLFLISASIKEFTILKTLPLFERKKIWGWIKFSMQILWLSVFLWTDVKVINGFTTSEKGIDIGFPLREGFIVHGGSSKIVNYHHKKKTPEQKYALDIVKLNSWGFSASGFFSDELHEYAIYGDTIFSPCDGKIVKLKDGLDDLPIGTRDKVNIAGNHIVLEYKDNLILFAHLIPSSLMVKMGDFIIKGQPIARVGNSGNTTEPHLHIAAISGTDTSKIIRGGNGIPIYFEGQFLIRNDRIAKSLFSH